MKTFKLKQLHIVDLESDTYEYTSVPLLDGLIINREDNENRWLVEAYVEGRQMPYFQDLKSKYEELIIHVRITTESNELATCIASIIGINKIGDHMNVLLLGKMVDRRTAKLENELVKLTNEGYRGEELLKKFKSDL
ncbi:YwpF-like family protein [Oceanobacillus luteolus]|uniref:YwpF-like family protein n=1 Tax=Oceanobacillus luteolus TaxID=1274358 RepID=UPI00203DD5D4|nr:YwpF-like family protein [Oceanobacillus luteolus]MCM3739862.1 YwpF-like family protein [Oceanobacillus luteolus]